MDKLHAIATFVQIAERGSLTSAAQGLDTSLSSVVRTLATLEQLPHDLSRLLRNARRGRVHVGLELQHLKRVGDQIDRAANRLALALVLAALIIGSSIVMTVSGGPTLLGLPLFGLLGFTGAVLAGILLLRSISRSSHIDDDEGG